MLGFEHPFLQSLFMFAGEVVCLVVFHILLCSYSERAVSHDIGLVVIRLTSRSIS